MNVERCWVFLLSDEAGDDKALDRIDDVASLADAAKDVVFIGVLCDFLEKSEPIDISSLSASSRNVKRPIFVLKFSF